MFGILKNNIAAYHFFICSRDMDQLGDNMELPHNIRELDPDTFQQITSHFNGMKTGLVRVGKNGYLFEEKYSECAQEIYNMEVRSDDVWVQTFPRSGTTLTQELVWLLANDLDYETAAEIPQYLRFPFVDMDFIDTPGTVSGEAEPQEDLEIIKRSFSIPVVKNLKDMEGRRFIKTHLAPSLLPPTLLNARVVYVARDPRDVVVSFYHQNRLIKTVGYIGDFKTYWDLFRKDLIRWTPYFAHIKEAWALRNESNFLFLFYEDLAQDLPGQVRRVSNFLGKTFNDSQFNTLCEYLSIENFKKNPSVNRDYVKKIGGFVSGEQEFIRKGQAGGWRDYFDEEMTREAEAWIKENLKNTDIKFPSIP